MSVDMSVDMTVKVVFGISKFFLRWQ